MSRRPPPNPAAERAAQNQQTIKSLLKLEPNKICADCKRNKHPRWASWNLGVFVCIRCSGIHRGMGTHISRVKSVDLDSWTDEQLQSILSWGNARANKYWEAKLAAGHVPSEAKIENFIRTKYELKRWVMDGPMPDPSTLDAEGDDDIPLSIVKEKQNIERKESLRKSSAGQSASPGRRTASQGDLIGGDPVPPRASTAGPSATRVPPKADPVPPKATSTKDSLLGLDFLGGESAPPPRPASTTAAGGTGGQSRPDLKQSILSLYAAAPRSQPQPPPQAQSHNPSGSFGGMQSPVTHQSQGSFGGLNDAFSSLSFGGSSGPKSPQTSAFSNTGGNQPSNRPAPQAAADPFSNLGGGGFFDPKPTPSVSAHQAKPSFGSSGGFGGFTSASAAPGPQPKPVTTSSSAGQGDLFDFSSPAPQPAVARPANPGPPVATNSVFNLSSNQPKPSPATTTTTINPLGSMTSNNLSNADVWGGNAWSTPDTNASAPVKSPTRQPAASTAANDFGWGSSTGSLANQSIVPGASGGFGTAPKVAADEEFGGWSGSAGGGSGAGSGTAKPAGGFGNTEDLFSNVWQ